MTEELNDGEESNQSLTGEEHAPPTVEQEEAAKETTPDAACEEHPDGCPSDTHQDVPGSPPLEIVAAAKEDVAQKAEELPPDEYAKGLPENVNWDVVEGIRYCPCGCPVVVLFGPTSEVRGLVPFTLDDQPMCPFCYRFDLFGLPEQYDAEQMAEVSRSRAIELANKLREKGVLYRRVSSTPSSKSQLIVPSAVPPTDLLGKA